MSWADKKILDYKNGTPATFFEKRNLEHANPVLFTLIVIGMAIIIWGLWEHNLTAIGAGMILAFAGHVYVWTRK